MVPSSTEVNGLRVAFEAGGIKTVVSVSELDDATSGVANRQVVLGGEIFQSFHQSPLHVSCFRSLDSSINKALTTRNSMEQELCCPQP
jgi:hypothetical protein